MSKHVSPGSVEVTVFARLHMGFIDLNGGLGRRFGSIGLALEHPSTRIAAWRHEVCSAEGPDAVRAMACAHKFIERAGIAGGVKMQIAEAIPGHAGLGSGTQMALAVGTAIAKLYELPVTVREIAVLTSRGARSGIGIGAFENGGLLLDGGRGENTVVPPIIARLDFPPAWRVLLVFDERASGVHGNSEVQAFTQLPEFPSELAAELSRRVLMQALPALVEQNLVGFGQAIKELQRHVGDYFASAQGGGRYASTEVANAMAWLETQGVNCVGQSSWGPTGFAVVGSEREAERLLSDLNLMYPDGKLRFALCRARNMGGIVSVDPGRESGYRNLDKDIT
jgi:beta-ribofuranosylaminobenzene 5'-phosphate synthase